MSNLGPNVTYQQSKKTTAYLVESFLLQTHGDIVGEARATRKRLVGRPAAATATATAAATGLAPATGTTTGILVATIATGILVAATGILAATTATATGIHRGMLILVVGVVDPRRPAGRLRQIEFVDREGRAA